MARKILPNFQIMIVPVLLMIVYHYLLLGISPLVCNFHTWSVCLTTASVSEDLPPTGYYCSCLDNFVSNDCDLDETKLWLITGPNMGGERVYMCLFVCMCLCMFVCVCVRVCARAHVHACMYMYVRTWMQSWDRYF